MLNDIDHILKPPSSHQPAASFCPSTYWALQPESTRQGRIHQTPVVFLVSWVLPPYFLNPSICRLGLPENQGLGFNRNTWHWLWCHVCHVQLLGDLKYTQMSLYGLKIWTFKMVQTYGNSNKCWWFITILIISILQYVAANQSFSERSIFHKPAQTHHGGFLNMHEVMENFPAVVTSRLLFNDTRVCLKIG